MRKGEATRERILDRAFRLAGRHGVRGVTLGLLATDLGLSKSGLFAHFASKDDLCVEVLRTTTERFTEAVVRPALRAPRGEPRIRRLFENWLAWLHDPALPGGCPIVAASSELDDEPGAPREFLVGSQNALLATLAKAASLAVSEGHFRADLDADQFSFEMMGIVLACHHVYRLLGDERAGERARAAFESLMEASRRR